MSDTRLISDLRSHPENSLIFGDPEECDAFDVLLTSIRKLGVLEPLAIKADGTILAGHLRKAAAAKAGLKLVPVRVVPPFPDYRAEVEFVIRQNTDRRQLTKAEVAMAFKRLKELPVSAGGTKRKMGRPKGAREPAEKCGARPTLSKSRDDAAAVLGVGVDEARALETVFTTPGVPEELKTAVNRGAVKPTPAAKAVKAEEKRQGGSIADPTVLKAVASKPEKPKTMLTPSTHEERVAEESAKLQRDERELFELYRNLDHLLTRRPLKSIIGPTEHQAWAQLCRDISLRAWREVESVHGNTTVGKQMALTVIRGEKS